MSELPRRNIIRTGLFFCAGQLLSQSRLAFAEAKSLADGVAKTQGVSDQVSLDAAADCVFNYLVTNSTCNPPKADFWRNPKDSGLTPDQNGWQGAQSIQSGIINYEATREKRYLKVVHDFSGWIENVYSGKDNLALCETWPGWDMASHQPIGKPPSHFCIWCDDSGWVVNLYLQLYQYAKKDRFLDIAYETLINLDKRWAVDFQRNSRGLMYYDHQDRYSIYISAQIIGALGLFDVLRTVDAQKANNCLEIASKYYNFVENYLHSTGRGRLNITGAEFGVAMDLFEEECNFGFGDKVPPPNAKSTLKHDLFTSTHMMMTAAYAMFEQAEKAGGDIGQVNHEFRDFRARAIGAADAFVRVYPEGYVEEAANGSGTVVMNLFDTNVNGFGCYWWTKYIVPLNPKQYGGVILRTAREIINEQGIGDVSSPCWNSVGCTAENSHSPFGNKPEWVTVRQAGAASMIASARWIVEAHPELHRGTIADPKAR
jgi:hypothetical protein